jgi:Do/DeqQ family serine protease
MIKYKKLLFITILTTILNNTAIYAHMVGAENITLATMLKQTMPSIVSISGMRRIKPVSPLLQPGTESNQQNEEQVSISIGSGVIINKEKGYIATNSHVVDNLEEIRVTLADQRKFSAELLGQDPASDLALLKIDAENLVEIKFANSDSLQVGDFVVAIGNPYGFSHTVTSGIVSALGRTDIGFDGYYDFIQTDAAINFGNSGGGLVNLKGELVGINTAIISSNNNGGGNIGLGLAIPSNMARGILAQLENVGRVDRGPLGVRVQSLNPELAEGFGINISEGAIIIDIIPNTAAEKAGLHIGDVLTKIDNKNIKDANHLRTLVSLIPIDKTTTIIFFREGKMHSSIITINNPNDQFTDGEQIFSGLVGIALEETPPEYPIQGVRIAKFNISKTIPLLDMEQPQLQEDDVIIAANYQSTPNIAALKVTAKIKPNVLLLKIMREKTIFFIAIKANKPKVN